VPEGDEVAVNIELTLRDDWGKVAVPTDFKRRRGDQKPPDISRDSQQPKQRLIIQSNNEIDRHASIASPKPKSGAQPRPRPYEHLR
jgi:hypothetical protein